MIEGTLIIKAGERKARAARAAARAALSEAKRNDPVRLAVATVSRHAEARNKILRAVDERNREKADLVAEIIRIEAHLVELRAGIAQADNAVAEARDRLDAFDSEKRRAEALIAAQAVLQPQDEPPAEIAPEQKGRCK